MSCPYSGAAASQKPEKIPQPPEHLFGLLGNVPDVDPGFFFKDIWKLQKLYGPVMKLKLAQETLFVGDREYVDEICDEDRFYKIPPKIQVEVRDLTGDGLFTAFEEEKNWGIAHRLLTPAFGPMGIRKMFGDMLDISSQLVLKWDRLGPDHEIECSDDFTRLAFDTIGLCAFSYRFNQFYSEEPHQFPRDMGDFLLESGKKAVRPAVLQALYYRTEQSRQEKCRNMHKLCDQIVEERKKNPQPDNHDLLNVMLNSVDRQTGEKLSDENIRFQMATFLVAGHETTSSTLSFTYLNLLKNPETFIKAQQQVDEVVGDGVLTLEHIPKLTYIEACIQESLRLSSPINGWAKSPREDTTLGGGKYAVPKGCPIITNLKSLHSDPAAWGEDVEVFRPERLLDGGFSALPPNSWKPFGSGSRGCIGRYFAMQEMVMNIALVLQRFQLELADPSYNLELKSTLTIKPHNFRMKARRRPGKSINVGIPGSAPAQAATAKKHSETKKSSDSQTPDASGKSVKIFFGGNTGTCEAMAQTLQTTLTDKGLTASIDTLDSATERLPDEHPIIIITASYEGHPADNAKKFVSWLENLKEDDSQLKGKKFAVFAVGNSDWATTFHRIPTLVDARLAAAGASRIVDKGSCDVKVDMIGPFEEWEAKLCEALTDSKDGDKPTKYDQSSIEVSIRGSSLSETLAGNKVTYGTVIAKKELAGTAVGPAKQQIDIKLADGVEYQAGDYLVVVPHNPAEVVERVLAYFGLCHHDIMEIKGSSKKFLPHEPTSVGEFLMTAVELSNPITKRQLDVLLSHANNDEQKAGLKQLVDSYDTILEKRLSILDVLEDQKVPLPFGVYVDMLQALLPRQYSIASSSIKNHEIASLCFDVHESPARSGHGMFHGVASTYLGCRRVGDRITCFVRPTNCGFRIPAPDVPITMMAAGSGIAPMRAFLEERAAIAEAGVRDLAPAVLYFGCRDNEKDFIYKDELEEWEKKGIVKVRTAFSRSDRKYVQDLVWEDRDQLADMMKAGGKIFLCGSAARLGKSVADVCKKIWMEKQGGTEEEAEKFLESVKTVRYVSDVY